MDEIYSPQYTADQAFFPPGEAEQQPSPINSSGDSTAESEEENQPEPSISSSEEEDSPDSSTMTESKVEDDQPKNKKPSDPLFGQVTIAYIRQRATYVILMGNNGEKPLKPFKGPDDRPTSISQTRTGQLNLDVKEAKPQPIDDESRLEVGGKNSTSMWSEDLFREHVLHGLCFTWWVGKVITDAQNKEVIGEWLHVYKDASRLTEKDVDDYFTWVEKQKCRWSSDGFYESGQLTLKSLGPELKGEILAGESGNMWGTRVLLRVFQRQVTSSVDVVAVARKRLAKISLKDSGTCDISKIFTDQKLALEDLNKLSSQEFKNHHFSRDLADGFWPSDKHMEDHTPFSLRMMLHEFKEWARLQPREYRDVVAKMHEISTYHRSQVAKNEWEPLSNAKKTKEASEITLLTQRLAALEKKNQANLQTPDTGAPPGVPNFTAESKHYPNDIWAKLSPAQKAEVSALKRKEKNASAAPGTSSGGRTRIPPITGAHDPPTDEMKREGTDPTGAKTGYWEYYCSQCPGPTTGSKGKWTYSHGDKHPETKHTEDASARRASRPTMVANLASHVNHHTCITIPREAAEAADAASSSPPVPPVTRMAAISDSVLDDDDDDEVSIGEGQWNIWGTCHLATIPVAPPQPVPASLRDDIQLLPLPVAPPTTVVPPKVVGGRGL